MNVDAAVAGDTTRECIHFNKNNSHTPIIFITVLLLFYYWFITVLLLVLLLGLLLHSRSHGRGHGWFLHFDVAFQADIDIDF